MKSWLKLSIPLIGLTTTSLSNINNINIKDKIINNFTLENAWEKNKEAKKIENITNTTYNIITDSNNNTYFATYSGAYILRYGTKMPIKIQGTDNFVRSFIRLLAIPFFIKIFL